MKHIFLPLFFYSVFLSQVFCQKLTREQQRFLKTNAKPVHYDSITKTADWSPLLPHLKTKKIILLGEFNHGSREVFEVRNSLIHYLCKELGVKAILLESGIGEVASVDLDRDKLTARQMLNGLFGGWRTKEFTDLMEYVKQENISVAGFDVQRTGSEFRYLLQNVVKNYAIDTSLVYALEARFGTVTRSLSNSKTVYDSVQSKTNALITDYKKVSVILKSFIAREDSNELLFTNVAVENRIRYLSYMLRFVKDRNFKTRWAARDSAMAANTQWLIDTFYKNQPVIIIAHNFHIGKYNESEIVMGELLKEKNNTAMYSIGFFAGSGSYHDNFGKIASLIAPDSAALDIKHIVNHASTPAFIDIPEKFSAGSQWLNHEIVVNDTFINLNQGNKMNLSKTFDGLILIKKVSPPKANP